MVHRQALRDGVESPDFPASVLRVSGGYLRRRTGAIEGGRLDVHRGVGAKAGSDNLPACGSRVRSGLAAVHKGIIVHRLHRIAVGVERDMIDQPPEKPLHPEERPGPRATVEVDGDVIESPSPALRRRVVREGKSVGSGVVDVEGHARDAPRCLGVGRNRKQRASRDVRHAHASTQKGYVLVRP